MSICAWCTMSICAWYASGSWCDETPTAVFTGGCFHEHLAEVPVCAAHLARAQGLDVHRLDCSRCHYAGAHGHSCLVTITGARRLAAWRTTDRGERARALQVPKPPPIPNGQEALFTL